jgi:hypothetical protein
MHWPAESLGTQSGNMLKTLAVWETLRNMVVPNVPKIVRKGEAAKAA